MDNATLQGSTLAEVRPARDENTVMAALLQRLMLNEGDKAVEVALTIGNPITMEQTIKLLTGLGTFVAAYEGPMMATEKRGMAELFEAFRQAETAARQILGEVSTDVAPQGPCGGKSSNLGNTCYANAVALMLESTTVAPTPGPSTVWKKCGGKGLRRMEHGAAERSMCSPDQFFQGNAAANNAATRRA